MKAWLSNILFFMNKYKNFLLLLLLIMLICAISVDVIWPNAYFRPINGNYQSYNFIRRLFDSQIPYKDFIIYLGPLHLYLGAFFTWLFGNNFIASVYAYEFLTLSTFVFFCFTLGKAFKIKFSKICLYVIFLVLTIYFTHNLVESCWVKNLTSMIITQGNSARLLRALPLSLACLSLIIINESMKSNLKKITIGGFVVGLISHLSPDYGTTTLLAYLLIVLCKYFIQIIVDKQVLVLESIKIFSIHVLSLGLGFLTGCIIFSLGHPLSLIHNNAGIASYQGWIFHYYNIPIVCHLYKLKLDFWSNIQALVVLFCIYKMFFAIKNKNETILLKYEISAWLNLASWGAIQSTQLMAGGGTEVPLIILFITFLIWGFNYIQKFDLEKYNKAFTAIIILITLIFSIIHPIIKYRKYVKSPIPVLAKIGGKISNHTEDVIDAAKFIGDKKIFSTHASVLEDYTNQIHPASADYIIHVLGKKAEENYIKTFKNNEFSYVTVQKDENTKYAASGLVPKFWFFYRELYKNYKPVYTNNYLTLWEKSSDNVSNKLPKNSQVEIIKISDSIYKIILNTDNSITGVAELKLKYNIDVKNKLKSKFLLYRKLLQIVQDSEIELEGFDEGFYTYRLTTRLPQNADTYIPIYVVNGQGELTFIAEPHKHSMLNIEKLEPFNYYESPMKFIEIQEILYDKNIVKINNTHRNRILFDKISFIKLGEGIYQIESNVVEEDYIYIKVKENMNFSDNRPYFLELCKTKICY